MTKVVALMSMSLDGYVADLEDGVDEVFDWYFSGDVDVPTSDPNFTFHVSPASAEYLRALKNDVGAMLTGRRTSDRAGAWGGHHPFGGPAFVLTHEEPEVPLPADSTVYFVTDGLESAVAQAKAAAGDKFVGMHGADTIRQCLEAGLLDEIRVDLVPLLLGSGIRLFDRLESAPLTLGNPTVVEGVGVTHLSYPVLKG
ncbi:dihydrofolate reductase family protein [Arthrobacter bambusae]|uniref:dihydrofolate reductase family protein n=1 Tax=Arthrobacter bambusae TaxID=1338426 RepID=UPI002782B68D|nr:dihydrofolate reductase family protein [Arthrobacter bambusae]MDQ0031899.1 dihydrofolate reductase [Arthrobacter bambusae]MDQ0100072.1 dihydrofolate reductase [Arthrobacter bambusae]